MNDSFTRHPRARELAMEAKEACTSYGAGEDIAGCAVGYLSMHGALLEEIIRKSYDDLPYAQQLQFDAITKPKPKAARQ